MKRKKDRKGKRLTAWLGILLCLALGGCGAAGTDSSVSENTEISAKQEATLEAEGQEADRYAQLIDVTGQEGKLVIYFLDLEVGPDATDKSGDAMILISPDGEVMLLDAGHPDAAEIIISVLRDLQIEKIDYLVCTHPHIDHIGGVAAIADAFPITTAYRTEVEHTTKTYASYVEALEKHDIETVYVKTGDVISFGEEVRMEVLGPDEGVEYPEDFPENSTQFLNNESLLLKLTYGESTALFGGDLYVTQERKYVEQYGEKLQADIVKANHHGIDTSNCNKWIKTVQAKYVIAMNDRLGSMDVYNNYVKNGAEYHLTQEDGVVRVVMDAHKNYEVVDQWDSWLN
ncbi:MAG: ComEC/Rec2 family competence protein [Acetatifactor sp.]